jgi:hypothetical protein
MSTDESRADYMMEAFLDEQNTLIRPLVTRKLALVHALEERSQIVEKLLEEARKTFLKSVVVPGTPKRGSNPSPDQLDLIERMEDDLDQIAEEKVNICLQLMDLVRRPYDTILEVEAALQIAAERDGTFAAHQEYSIPQELPQSGTAARRQSAAVPAAAPPEAELWCFCRKPDDGRQMVACDNSHCDIGWWHTDCLDDYIASHHIGSPPPEDERKWVCPICMAADIVNREDKRRRKRQ